MWSSKVPYYVPTCPFRPAIVTSTTTKTSLEVGDTDENEMREDLVRNEEAEQQADRARVKPAYKPESLKKHVQRPNPCYENECSCPGRSMLLGDFPFAIDLRTICDLWS